MWFCSEVMIIFMNALKPKMTRSENLIPIFLKTRFSVVFCCAIARSF